MNGVLKKQLSFLDSNPRHKALFLLLLRNDDYVTCDELAQQLQVTSRTIKSDLKSIKTNFEFSEIDIISHRSKGNKVEILDEEVKNEIIKYYQIFQTETIDTDFERTVYYIARRLLSTKKPIKIETLQSELFVNTNYTFNKEINSIRALFELYNLKLIFIPRVGLVVQGDLFNRCLMLVRMYRYFDQYNQPEFSDKKYTDLFAPKFLSKDEIRSVFCDNILKTRIVFSDIHLERIILFFILLTNLEISDDDITDNMRDMDFDYTITEEYKLIRMICTTMKSKSLAYNFENEVFIRFLSYMAIMSTDLYRIRDCTTENYGNLVMYSEDIRSTILSYFENCFYVNAFDDETVLKDLIKVLIPISMKIKLGVSDDIDLGYFTVRYNVNKPVMSKFTNHLAKVVATKYSYKLSDREKHILLNVLYEYINNITLDHKKVNIALVAIDGRINTQQIKFTLKNFFSSYVKKIDTKVIYELDKLDTSQYDYFFCTGYGKNMNIPYKPLFFFQEGLSDFEYYKQMQNILLTSFNYDKVLPKIKYNVIDPIYRLGEFPCDDQLEPGNDYLSIYLGEKNEIQIYLGFNVKNEGINVFYYDNAGIDTQGKQFYVVMNTDINYDKQKFKMVLEFVAYIAKEPNTFKENCANECVDIKKFVSII